MSDDAQVLVGYFGFGSLVNRHTLRTSYVDIVPATLIGWRRHWQARTETLPQKIALLSIHQDPTCEIHGMIVIDHAANLVAVDEREEGYSRVALTPSDLRLPNDVTLPEQLYVYVADEVIGVIDDGALLQSYLDAVMQGFHLEYGSEGVAHFVDTTAKFDRPILRDREMPFYPRSVIVSNEEADLFDSELRRAGAAF